MEVWSERRLLRVVGSSPENRLRRVENGRRGTEHTSLGVRGSGQRVADGERARRVIMGRGWKRSGTYVHGQ